MRKCYGASLFVLSFLVVLPARAFSQLSLDLETGRVYSEYNDVRIPGDGGTKFSLTDDLSAEPAYFFRARAGYLFGARHSVSALVAPLRVYSSGSVDHAITFDKTTFPAGAELDARFRFDSYRLTYRYDFYRAENFTVGAGLTANIRDASISVSDGSQREEYSNTGFAPLLNFRLSWRFSRPVGVLLEGDALLSPQGRAEDVLAAFCGPVTGPVSWKAGYRILEGGSDNDEVYTFSMFHYVVVGLIIVF
jgi:hypothetical protein